jgi:hypothetical protein
VDRDAHTTRVQTPEPEPWGLEPDPIEPRAALRPPAGIWAIGDRLTWVAGLVLALSPFMDWYAGREGGTGGFVLSVIGWHTGPLGKLVFLIGVVLILLVVVRELFGLELPPVVPESLVVVALGALATIFVLVRLIWIPDTFLPASGRGIGIYVALIASLAVIAAGLLRAGEEL